MVKKCLSRHGLIGMFLIVYGARGMQDTSPLSLMTTNRVSFSPLPEGNSPRMGMQVSSVSFEQRGAGSPIAQILAQIALSRQRQQTQAERVFLLQRHVEELRKEIDKSEKELDSLTRQSDWDRQEQDNFEALARELEKGEALASSLAQCQDRSFLLYLRNQACLSRSVTILQKLLEADPSIKSDLQALGLFALTDDPQDVTDSADKMQALAQAGIDLCCMKSVDSCSHALIRDGKDEVVRSFIEKNPAILTAVDGKGRSGFNVAVERYVTALSEKGRRSIEYDEAYKILKCVVDQQQILAQRIS